jgi:hypothetical protein
MTGRPKILAIDLDNTTLWDKSPELGNPIDGITLQLEALRAAGWKIVIWTVRDEPEKIAEKLKAKGVPYDYINDHPWNFSSSRKIYADVYLDDRGMNFDGDTKGLAEKIMKFVPWTKRNPMTGK